MRSGDPMLAPLARGYEAGYKPTPGGETATCSSSALTEQHVSLQALSTLEQCVEATEGLEADDAPTRSRAARQLAELIENTFGEEAAMLGAYMRESGGVGTLIDVTAPHLARLSPTVSPRTPTPGCLCSAVNVVP